jgi:hypothetical protein
MVQRAKLRAGAALKEMSTTTVPSAPASPPSGHISASYWPTYMPGRFAQGASSTSSFP